MIYKMTDKEAVLFIRNAYKSVVEFMEMFRKPGIIFTKEQKKKMAEYIKIEEQLIKNGKINSQTAGSGSNESL